MLHTQQQQWGDFQWNSNLDAAGVGFRILRILLSTDGNTSTDELVFMTKESTRSA